MVWKINLILSDVLSGATYQYTFYSNWIAHNAVLSRQHAYLENGFILCLLDMFQIYMF